MVIVSGGRANAYPGHAADHEMTFGPVSERPAHVQWTAHIAGSELRLTGWNLLIENIPGCQ